MEHENCDGELTMGRYVLLWLLGVPIPILILILISFDHPDYDQDSELGYKP